MLTRRLGLVKTALSLSPLLPLRASSSSSASGFVLFLQHPPLRSALRPPRRRAAHQKDAADASRAAYPLSTSSDSSSDPSCSMSPSAATLSPTSPSVTSPSSSTAMRPSIPSSTWQEQHRAICELAYSSGGRRVVPIEQQRSEVTALGTIVASSQVREAMMKEVWLDGEVEVTVDVRAHDKIYLELAGWRLVVRDCNGLKFRYRCGLRMRDGDGDGAVQVGDDGVAMDSVVVHASGTCV